MNSTVHRASTLMPHHDLSHSRKRRGRSRAKAEAPILVPIETLRPTQAAVGMRAVAAKREKVERRAGRTKEIVRFLEKRPIPAVLGPGDDYYIIDHHHLSLALLQSEVTEAFVRVIDDLSWLPPAQFWKKMAAGGRLHPFDHLGQRIAPSALPATVKDLKRDPHRDLAWSVREAGGFIKTSAPYSEFRWAQFFRNRIPRTSVLRDFEYAHDRGMMLARSRAAARLPGFNGIGV